MSRLHQKFMTAITLVLIAVLGISILLNSRFVERFYMYQKKMLVNGVCRELLAQPENHQAVADAAFAEHGIVIAVVENTGDNDRLNVLLRTAFLEQGLAMEQYWLWDQDYEAAVRDGRKLRIYRQPHLNYSLLVVYADLGGQFAGAAMIVPELSEVIRVVNLVTTLVITAAIVVIVLLLYILIRRILRPVRLIGDAAGRIGEGEFEHIRVDTGDELEELAGHINQMSDRLSRTQSRLKDQNRQMEALLRNVSHDLKTPAALIRAYSAGLRDGMDDGTFADTIWRQSGKMEYLLNRILDYSAAGTREAVLERTDLAALVQRVLMEYESALAERKLHVTLRLPEPGYVAGPVCVAEPGCVAEPVYAAADPKLAYIIFDNLLSNALKYAAGDEIAVSVSSDDAGVAVVVSNDIDPAARPDPDRIWEPFYVGEDSRNKALSGHGLGLSIVRAAAVAQGAQCRCQIRDGRICFEILFPPEST